MGLRQNEQIAKAIPLESRSFTERSKNQVQQILEQLGLPKSELQKVENFFKFITKLTENKTQKQICTLDNSKLINLYAKNVFSALSSIEEPVIKQNKEFQSFKNYLDFAINYSPSLEMKKIADLTFITPDTALNNQTRMGCSSSIAWSKNSFFISECDAVVMMRIEPQKGYLEICTKSSDGKIKNMFDEVIATDQLETVSLKDQILKLGFKEIENGLYEKQHEPGRRSLFLMNESGQEGVYFSERNVDKFLFANSAELVGINNSKDSIHSSDTISYIFRSDRAIFELDHLTNVKDVQFSDDLSFEELRIKQIPPYKEKNGFTIAGKNESEIISSIDAINEIDLSVLEQRLKPGQYSSQGFIGQNESLIEILKDDNDFVLKQGFTHQELSKPLKFTMEISDKRYGPIFKYNEEEYRVSHLKTRGIQESPFDEETGNTVYKVTRLRDSKTLEFADLLPGMIEKYGFYEGIETSYRVEPRDVIEFFNLKR